MANRKLPTETATPPKPAPQPKLPAYVPLPEVKDTFGISKSAVYRAVSEGRIVMRKLGRSSLVESRSVLEYLASLPTATVRTAA